MAGSSKVGRPRDMKLHKAHRGCSRQTTKKYRTRPSPAYPANLCRGKSKKGHDGRMYVSSRSKNEGLAYYRWIRKSNKKVAKKSGKRGVKRGSKRGSKRG